ncbi:MAG: glycosyltransferase family 39 protein [bacterium]|nr:glycosyltransferase family 39 protein [bacterium]
MKELFNKYYNFIVIFLVVLILVSLFDKVLSLGLIVLAFLTLITFFILSKLGLKNKTLTWLLIIALIIHLGTVLFIYYFNFQPLSGGTGGYTYCHLLAVKIAENFRGGNFSFEGIPYYETGDYIYRFYPLIIGSLYAVTMPEMLIGQIFQVWLAVLFVLFTYLIVKEIGGSNKQAFLIGLIVNIYPSYLFYGSLLLKDALVASLALSGLLFCLKLIKKFSWKNFIVFYLILAGLFNFRFYIAYALLFPFIFCYLFVFNLNLRKKIIYAIIIIPLLGFLPEILLNQGFMGINVFNTSFSEENISFYQQKAYDPLAQTNPENQEVVKDALLDRVSSTPSTPSTSLFGYESTWKREKVSLKESPFNFLVNYLKYFSYILFGPLPWQMKTPVHFVALLETIPWYLLFLFIIKGIYQSIRSRNKLVLPIILFSLLVLGAITVFINNFGIITRIRIPAFAALLCLIPLGFKKYD